MTEAHGTVNPWLPVPWRVFESRSETADTTTLGIRPAAGAALNPPPRAGQFNMLYAFGIGEAPISFSAIAGDALHHTVRRVGKVSDALARLQPGDLVGVRGPFGSHWPSERAYDRHLVLIAGGLGLAPLKPVVELAISRPGAFLSVHLLYGTRDPESLLFRDQLGPWESGLDLFTTVDTATNGWRGNVGVVTGAIDRLTVDPARTVAFLCGPEIMMRLSIDRLVQLGVPPDGIHVSMERSMKCAIGLCGHCQFGGSFVCREGPVYRYADVANRLRIPEL